MTGTRRTRSSARTGASGRAAPAPGAAGHLTPSQWTRIARIAYVAVVLIATLSDLHPNSDLGAVPGRTLRFFAVLGEAELRDVIDGLRNVALFAGFGAVWVVTAHGSIWRAAVRATLLGAGLSAFVEAVQLLSPVRTSSILDVITNTVGTGVGAVALCLVIVAVHGRQGQRSYVGIPAMIFAGGYGIAVVMETFAPLLREASLPNLGGGPIDRLELAWHAMDPGSFGTIPLIDLFIFLPLGIYVVAALAERGFAHRLAAIVTAVGGAFIAAVLEVLHGIIGHPIVWGAWLVHAIALALGATLGAWGLPVMSRTLRGARRPRVLYALYAAILVVWSWRPFWPNLQPAAIAEQFTAVHWIPLQALAIRVDVFSVSNVMAQFALYLPLGALLAAWPLRTHGPLRALWPAFYLSAMLELGKIVIEGRFFDITHILIQMAGAAVGWIVVRRSGFAVYGEALPSR